MLVQAKQTIVTDRIPEINTTDQDQTGTKENNIEQLVPDVVSDDKLTVNEIPFEMESDVLKNTCLH